MFRQLAFGKAARRVAAPLALALLSACATPDTQLRAADVGTAVMHQPVAAATPASLRSALPAPELKLIGLTAGEVDQLLGAPNHLRREQPAEVRQYRARDCVLFVFLYDRPAADARVEHVEARSRTTLLPMADAECLQQMSGRHVAGITH